MDRPCCGAWVLGPHLLSSNSCVLVVMCHRRCSSLVVLGPHSPYAGGGVGPSSPFVSGGLLCPSSLMVWWCGVPCCGSRVVVVGVPCHEGAGWLSWRVLVACGRSMMVVWWVLGIVVVVLPVVEGGGHSSLIVVKSGGGHSSPVVVEGDGGGGRWALMGCCCLHAVLVVLGSCRLSWVGGHRSWWMMVVVDLVPHCGVLASWTSSLSGKLPLTWHTRLNRSHATSVVWWWRLVLGATAIAVLRYHCHYHCRRP